MTQDLPTGYATTFGHVQAGPSRHYEFVGVFEIVQHMSNRSRWVYQRVADTITFDGLNHPTFSPERTKKLQDDQSAEALTPDPELVKQAQAQLDAGQYAAEDQHGVSKVRGSYQAVFAKRVKDNYGWECAVTGISTPEFLIASHIVPWSEDKEIRTDPTNGICLSVFVNRAFDAGFLEVTPEYQLVVRWDRIPEDPILKFELRKFDGSDLKTPIADPPDPAKLARRIELGY